MRASIWTLVFWGLDLLESIYIPSSTEMSKWAALTYFLTWLVPFVLLLKKDIENKNLPKD